jgi:antitoxin MazE
MKVNLVSIGNSKGIRIPRSIIKACGFGDQVEMRVDQVEMRVGEGVVVLAPARTARQGWEEAFAKMAATGDDALIVPEHLEHEWDAEEWEW